MGHLVGEDSGELLIIGLAQESGGDDVLPLARAARIDVIVFHDGDLHLVQRPLVVRGLSRSACAGSMRAVERGALAGAPAVGLGVPDDGAGLETGAAQAATSEPAAMSATSGVFMAATRSS